MKEAVAFATVPTFDKAEVAFDVDCFNKVGLFNDKRINKNKN